MPTECSAEQFDFGRVEGRIVEAAFDAGLVTSDAGALLLGATDRAISEARRYLSQVHLRRPNESILDRAEILGPATLLTLDALHLASIEFLRGQGQSIRLAAYDERLLEGARALGVPIADI